MDHVLGSRKIHLYCISVPHLFSLPSLFQSIPRLSSKCSKPICYVWTKRICPNSSLTKNAWDWVACCSRAFYLENGTTTWINHSVYLVVVCACSLFFWLCAGFNFCATIYLRGMHKLIYRLPSLWTSSQRGTLISLKKPEDTIHISWTCPSCFSSYCFFRKPFQFLISKDTGGQARCFFVFANRL